MRTPVARLFILAISHFCRTRALSINSHTHSARQSKELTKLADSAWDVKEYFIINLKYRSDRWDLVSKQFVDQGLSPTRVEAVSGKDLVFLQGPSWLGNWQSYMRDREATTVARHSKVNQYAVDPKVVTTQYSLEFLSRYDHNVDGSKTVELSPGEVGCILSHVGIWRRVAAEKSESSPISCIFEDDVRLTPNFSQKLSVDLGELPSDADMLYLSYMDMDPGNDVTRSEHLFAPHVLTMTQAYCLSPKGASQLLNLLPVEGALDVWLAKQFPQLKVYGTAPRLAGQHPEVGRGDNDIEHTAYSEGATHQADTEAVSKWWREQGNV